MPSTVTWWSVDAGLVGTSTEPESELATTSNVTSSVASASTTPVRTLWGPGAIDTLVMSSPSPLEPSGSTTGPDSPKSHAGSDASVVSSSAASSLLPLEHAAATRPSDSSNASKSWGRPRRRNTAVRYMSSPPQYL